MKGWKVFILCISTVLMFSPIVLASNEYPANQDVIDNQNSNETDYTVSILVGNFSEIDNSSSSIKSTYYIREDQTITHYVSVDSGVNYLEVGLNWGDPSDSLTLSILTLSHSIFFYLA